MYGKADLKKILLYEWIALVMILSFIGAKVVVVYVKTNRAISICQSRSELNRDQTSGS